MNWHSMNENAAEADDLTQSEAKLSAQNSGLLALIGAGQPDFDSVEAVDEFIKAERATWGKIWNS